MEWAIFSFLGLIIVLCGSLFFYQVTYANKIYRNVYVAGIDVSGKTKSQVASLISKKFNDSLDQEVTLRAEDKELKTKVSDTGLALDINKIVSLAYEVGRSNNFLEQLLHSAQTLTDKTNVPVEAEINQEKYNNFIAIAVAQFNSNPVNASLTVDAGVIKEVAEQDGVVVDTASLSANILGLGNNNPTKIIVLNVQKSTPEIKVANFADAKIEAESILAKKIQLTYEDKTFSPTRSDIGNWIVFTNSAGKVIVSLSDGNISAYLNKISSSFEVQKKDKKINAIDNSVIDPGQEGKYIDKKAALVSVKSQIKGASGSTIALTTYTEAPAEVKVFPSEGLVPGRYPGKYLDIDLTLQKLCRVDSTAVIDCFPVSTGKPGMGTPTGTYPISEKSPRHWSGKYFMWLPYWQRFIDSGYGIHELPETDTWKETAEHLGTPVSHGCVRLGVGPAEAVYNWTEIGTLIYIHK